MSKLKVFWITIISVFLVSCSSNNSESTIFLTSDSSQSNMTPTYFIAQSKVPETSSIPTIAIVPSETPAQTPAPTLISTPTLSFTTTSTPTVQPTETEKTLFLENVNLLLYNISYGGGRDGMIDVEYPINAFNCHYNSHNGDTYNVIISVLQSLPSDIVILNELCGGEELIHQISLDLGMTEHFVSIDYFDEHLPTGLLVAPDYSILYAESINYLGIDYRDGTPVRDIENSMKGFRAEVLTPQGNEIIVYGVHLTPQPSGVGTLAKQTQVQWLYDNFLQHEQGDVILAGDFNLSAARFTQILHPAGFREVGLWGISEHLDLAMRELNRTPVDLIWINKDQPNSSIGFRSPSQSIYFSIKDENADGLLDRMAWGSDHYPQSASLQIEYDP